MAGLLAKHRFVLVATWEGFLRYACQTSVWNSSNWGGIFAVMLGSQGDDGREGCIAVGAYI